MKGITDMRMASNCVYVWGNVLVFYDIYSSLTFLTLPQLSHSTPFFSNHVIKQLVPDQQGKRIALITDDNMLYLGTISCGFRSVLIRKYNQSVASMFGNSAARIIGLYFSFSRQLYVIGFLPNYTIKKYEIFINKSASGILYIFSCLNNYFIF